MAAFVLIMGISAALGLATYSLKATSRIRHQTVALGLAREGIEVVKNMRDTSWLRGETIESNCHNYYVDAIANSEAFCYSDWFTISDANVYFSEGGWWGLRLQPNPVGNNYPWTVSTRKHLANSTPETTQLMYDVTINSVTHANYSGYSRKVQVTNENFPPYNHPEFNRMKVTVVVWWTDGNCIKRSDVAVGDPCSVTLETYLTNWRTF